MIRPLDFNYYLGRITLTKVIKDINKLKKNFFAAEVLQHKTDIKSQQEKQYEENEVNGKFRITSERWSKQLEDRNSLEFQDLENTLSTGLKEMLMDNRDLSEKADFDVEIVKLT